MFSLFKKPEYRKFNLKPCYWDPEKEEREARERRIRNELKQEKNEKGECEEEEEEEEKGYEAGIRVQFRREYEKRKVARQGMNSGYTLRLFMILLLIFMVAFLMFIKNAEGIMRFFGM